MNDVKLYGRLTKDFDMRTAVNGNVFAFNGLAIDDSYINKGGEKIKKTVFVNFSVWGKQAENASRYTGKGNRVILHGKLDNKKKDDGYTELMFNVLRIDFVDFNNAGTVSTDAEEEKPF